jgi:hypothetical protein
MNVRALVFLLCANVLVACISGRNSEAESAPAQTSLELVKSFSLRCPAVVAAGSNAASGSGRYYLTWSQCNLDRLELLAHDLETGKVVNQLKFDLGDYSRVPRIQAIDGGAYVLIESPTTDRERSARHLCVIKWDDANKSFGPKFVPMNSSPAPGATRPSLLTDDILLWSRR